MILIKPWVGDFYSEGLDSKEELGPRKVLVVGESHYGEDWHLTEDLTIEVITRYCNVDPDSWEHESIAFYTKIATLLLEEKNAGCFSWTQMGKFYHKIAFCNFLQELAGNDADGYAKDALYEASVEPFKATVKKLKPDVMVVMKTNQLRKHFPELPVKTIWLPHLSRPVAYADCREDVKRIWE